MGSVQDILTIITIPLVAALLAYIEGVRRSSNTSIREVWQAVDDVREKHATFAIKVATEYVHGDRMKEFETRVMQAFERLEKKVDRISEAE
jgi:hypothetical protein